MAAQDKSQPTRTERVATILTRCKTSLIDDWLIRTKKTPELNHLHLGDQERTGHLPKLVDDLVLRLINTKVPTQDSDAIPVSRRIGPWQATTEARLFCCDADP